MARYAIDPGTALRLAREGIRVSDAHRLVAPNRLMSDVLSALYREVQDGGDRDAALARLDHLTTTRIRLLGDRVSRGTAWRLAEQLGWADTAKAEYVSVAKLQADALVTDDPELQEVGVPVAAFEVLLHD